MAIPATRRSARAVPFLRGVLRGNEVVPSPLGHALGGLAAGWLVSGSRNATVRDEIRNALLFAAAGIAPDLDLLLGAHRGPSHSIGAACLVGLLAFAVSRRAILALAIGLAYATHPLLDVLGSDTTAPIGVMALWPFSREYYVSGVHVFHAISRRYWLPDFWSLNMRAIAREVAILLPVAGLIAYVRKR